MILWWLVIGDWLMCVIPAGRQSTYRWYEEQGGTNKKSGFSFIALFSSTLTTTAITVILSLDLVGIHHILISSLVSPFLTNTPHPASQSEDIKPWKWFHKWWIVAVLSVDQEVRKASIIHEWECDVNETWSFCRYIFLDSHHVYHQ